MIVVVDDMDPRLEAALANPAKVQVLDLRGSAKKKLTSLPPEIGTLVNLEVLILDDNALTELPDEIDKCVKLRELHVANNKLTSLGQADFLRRLRVINAHGNLFKESTTGFTGYFAKDTELYFGNNPFTFWNVSPDKLALVALDTKVFLRNMNPKRYERPRPSLKEIHLYGEPPPKKIEAAIAKFLPNAVVKVFKATDGQHLLADPLGTPPKPQKKAAKKKSAKLHASQTKILSTLIARGRRVEIEEDYVREHAKPCVDLVTKRAKKPPRVGSTHIGGAPDLPKGTAWPKGSKGPMGFVAQVRLEDVAPFDAEHLLPKSGLLSFFLGAEEDDGSGKSAGSHSGKSAVSRKGRDA